MGIIEVFWQFSWSQVLEMLLRWILPHECPEEASLHTVPVKPYRDTPISQQAEHCGWHSLSQHGRMIGPRCYLPSLLLIVASAEWLQRMHLLDLPSGVSALWEHDRVGDLSSATLMRLKLRRTLKGKASKPILLQVYTQQHLRQLTHTVGRNTLNTKERRRG